MIADGDQLVVVGNIAPLRLREALYFDPHEFLGALKTRLNWSSPKPYGALLSCILYSVRRAGSP